MNRASSIAPADFGLSIGAEPVRRIRPKGHHTITSIFPTIKGTLPTLRAETLLEADGLEQFEINPDCVLMASQPHHLYWTEPLGGGRTRVRRYTPDLAILMSDGRICIVEFKVSHYAEGETWKRKEPFIREAYERDHFAGFETIDERDIYIEPRRTNAAIMMLHRTEARDIEAEVAVMAFAAAKGLPTTMGAIRAGTSLASGHPHANRAFSAVIALALEGVLRLDHSVPLGNDAVVLPGIPGARR